MSRNPGAAEPLGDGVQHRVEITERVGALILEQLVHQRGQPGPDRGGLRGAAADRNLLLENEFHAGERISDRGHIGHQPAGLDRAAAGTGDLSSGRPAVQRRSAAGAALGQRHVIPTLFGEELPLASVDSVVPPTEVISGSDATASTP